MRRLSNYSLFPILVIILMLLPSTLATPTGNNIYSDNSDLVTDTYPIGGLNHNDAHPEWGGTWSHLSRVADSEYSDNISMPSGQDWTNSRQLSNILCADPAGYGADPYDIPDEGGRSDMIWVFSQFITHDIVFTSNQRGQHQYPSDGDSSKLDVLIPEGDTIMLPGSYIPMWRSVYDLETGTNESNPREQLTTITPWIDGAVIYGTNEQSRADWLRAFEGGRLKIDLNQFGDMLPLKDPHNDSQPGMSFEGFGSGNLVAGDPRANEHVSLLSFHTLFVREHNRIADELNVLHPDWNDEQIYQRARKVNTALLQSITYNEFLPALGAPVSEYQGFDTEVDPSIMQLFTHSAFRMGHSQVGSWTLRLDENRTETAEGNIRLANGFFDTYPLTNEGGIEPILRGLAYQIEPKNDLIYSDDLRNQMFGAPGAGGMDMCAIDINRARDHGMPDYNTMRVAFSLDPISNWSEITSDSDLVAKLDSVYTSPDEADVFIGMMAEDHLDNSSLGLFMQLVISQQFEFLRDGDPLYYENDPDLTNIVDEITNTSLADVILRNTKIEKIQCNVFFAEIILDNMTCEMSNNIKGFVEYVPLVEDTNDTEDGSDTSSITPPLEVEENRLPGFGFNLTIISMLGATIALNRKFD